VYHQWQLQFVGREACSLQRFNPVRTHSVDVDAGLDAHNHVPVGICQTNGRVDVGVLQVGQFIRFVDEADAGDVQECQRARLVGSGDPAPEAGEVVGAGTAGVDRSRDAAALADGVKVDSPERGAPVAVTVQVDQTGR